MKFSIKYIIFILIILGCILIRFYQLNSLPPGLTIDESSQGYNAFSLLNTGKDRYGQAFPILFRLFDSFQAPLYTYLTVIPVYFLGNSILSVRIISALSGIILTVITFLLLSSYSRKKGNLAIIAAFIVSISPWAVFYSRICTEASLGVMLYILSLLCFYFSLKKRWLFPFAAFIIGLSTHAYYSERIISFLFLIGFIFIFRKIVFAKKKIFIFGILLFIVTQIPHIYIANSGAFTRRMAQVNYFSDQFFQESGGNLRNIFFGRSLFIIKEFTSQYVAYFSPKNLFFDPDPQAVRSMPDISAFYSWMIIPFLFGLRQLIKTRSSPFIKIIILLIIIGPSAASLTRDPFSTIRVLAFLWAITMVISFGCSYLLGLLTSSKVKFLFILATILLSISQLYLAYFVLLKYERSHNYGYEYLELLKRTEQLKNKKFVIDSPRQPAAGIMFAYLKKYNPYLIQQDLKDIIAQRYYDNFDPDEQYVVDNVIVRPIIWREDLCKDQILVGDLLSISEGQVKEHYLQFLFDIKDTAKDIALKAYQTNLAKCISK